MTPSPPQPTPRVLLSTGVRRTIAGFLLFLVPESLLIAWGFGKLQLISWSESGRFMSESSAVPYGLALAVLALMPCLIFALLTQDWLRGLASPIQLRPVLVYSLQAAAFALGLAAIFLIPICVLGKTWTLLLEVTAALLVSCTIGGWIAYRYLKTLEHQDR